MRNTWVMLSCKKTYTVDLLEKKRAANHGEVPQYYVKDSHEAIIPEQIFLEVQAEIARRAAMRKETNGRSCYTYKNALTKPHGQLLYRWKCRTRVQNGLKACDGPILHEDDLQNAVVQAIKQTICNPDEDYGKIAEGYIDRGRRRQCQRIRAD